MRCLYCGKELALLKRLTSGGDFCSEAHRQSYQDQFNELAIGRLDQARPAPERFPEEEVDVVEVGVGYAAKGQNARGSARTNGSQNGGSGTQSLNAFRSKVAQGPDAAPFVPDWFQPYPTGEAPPVGTEPPQVGNLRPAFPSRDPYAVAAGIPCEHKAAQATRVRWAAVSNPRQFSTVLRGRTPEAREFSRPATTPVPRLLRQGETSMPAAQQEEREISLTPRSPSPAKVWCAGAPEFAPLELTLGGWSRLDGSPLGSEAWLSVQEVVQASDSIATLERAVSSPVALNETPVAKQAEPEPVVKPLPVTLQGVGPVSDKPTLFLNTPGAGDGFAPKIPAATSLPLRPVMVLGPAPVANPALVQKAAPVTSPASTQKPVPVAATVPPPVKQPAAQAIVQPVATQTAPVQPESKPVEPPRDEAQGGGPTVTVPATPNLRAAPGKVRRDVRVIPAVQPAANKVEPPMPQGRVDSQPKRPEPPRVEPPPPEIVQPVVSSDYQAIHAPEEGRFAGLSSGVKMGIAAVALIIIAGLAYVIMTGRGKVEKVDQNASAGYEVGLPLANSGWIENWVPESSGKRISVLKGSQPLSHYRMEFQAQIETKAIGWMFRAMNPKNYYVAKIEALKPGLEPTVALVHYAVIDGKAETRVEKILPFPTKVGMMYKIRFEAVGPKFSAWVQDQKIDEWLDTRIGSGALGMYSEGTEVGLVNGIVNVTALVPK